MCNLSDLLLIALDKRSLCCSPTARAWPRARAPTCVPP